MRTYRFYPRDVTSRTFSCTISLDYSPWLPKNNLSRVLREKCVSLRNKAISLSLPSNVIWLNCGIINFSSRDNRGYLCVSSNYYGDNVALIYFENYFCRPTDLNTRGIPSLVTGPIPSNFRGPKSAIFFSGSFSISGSLSYSFFKV